MEKNTQKLRNLKQSNICVTFGTRVTVEREKIVYLTILKKTAKNTSNQEDVGIHGVTKDTE